MQDSNNQKKVYDSTAFYENIQNPQSNSKIFIQPNFVNRTFLSNEQEIVDANFRAFQEKAQGEQRKDFYGNPLTISDNLKSFKFNAFNSVSWEFYKKGEDFLDRLTTKPEDLIYQDDIKDREDLISLGLNIPDTGWTPKQLQRMIDYSIKTQEMDELNRVKSPIAMVTELGVNILPFLTPYTAVPYMLATDPILMPLSIFGLAGTRLAKTKAGKLGVAGSFGFIEGGAMSYLLDTATEQRIYEATGRVITQEEKINNAIFAGALGVLQFGVFELVAGGYSRFKKARNQAESILTDDRTSTIAREIVIEDLKKQGIANPEEILPPDKSTLTAKFDAKQDALKLANQIQKGIDLDMGIVRNIDNDPTFLKSNEAININGFNIFQTEYNINGKAFKTDYEIVEKASLTPSHDYLGNKIPHYPSKYQPRDRSTTASIEQINNIAQRPDPNKLIPSIDFFNGSPIVDTDGNVIIGNGRAIGLSRAYDIQKAEAYRQQLITSFPHLAPERFENPVLVRRFKPETPEDDISFLSRLSNDEEKLNYNIVETAKLDAENLINSNAISSYKKGSFESDSNSAFFSNFLETLPTNQKQNFLTKNGGLSQVGQTRIEAALIQYAYNNDNLTKFLYETQDDLSKNIVNAIKDIAPDIINIKRLIEGGELDANLDISSDISNAFEIYSISKRSGASMDIALNNLNIFGNDMPPMTEAILRTFFKDELNGKGIMPKGQLNDILNTFMARLQNTKTTANAFEFASEPYSPLKILEDVKKKLKPDYLPIKEADYTLNKQDYKENQNAGHEEIIKTITDEEGKKNYKKTLEDDAEMDQYIKCNNYQ